MGNTCLLLDDELRVTRNAGRKRCRKCNGLVKRVSVKGLGASKNCSHTFNSSAHNIVVWVSLGQGPSTRLTVCAQHAALGILRAKLFVDKLGPEHTGCS